MPATRVWIVVADGTHLAATLHLPDAALHPQPWPALLEALPYRKDDLSASSHADDYHQLADAGFAVCRLDLRGTGSSHGRATDEYPMVELDDLNDVIEWLAIQLWSNGRVGMFGYSYSGFNSLQVAATRPPALRAICAVYATDDRYTDDVHYMGGAVRAIDVVDYCHYMTVCNALPPVPAVFGGGWFDEWCARIDQHEPWILRWLREQTDGPYWRHGSLRPGYERIACPTMLVGGWADGYRNNTLRTFEALTGERELLVGPWSHRSPSRSLPGPHLDLGLEMIRFFGRWLRDDDVESVAPIRVFVRRATPPAPDLAIHRGDWLGLDRWTPSMQTYAPVMAGSDGASVDRLAVRPDVGTAAWISCAGGLPWGQSLDQRADDAWSSTYEWPVTESFTMLGYPVLHGRFAADAPVAYLSAKLCDISPDGTSQLITRGFLNLTHRRSSIDPTPMPPMEFEAVTVELEAAAWEFEPGHSMRLSLASTDWPNTWVPPTPVTLDIDRRSLRLELPCESGTDSHAQPVVIETPPPPAEPVDPTTRWVVMHDILGRTTTCTTSYGSTGDLPDGGTYAERYDGEVGVPLNHPAAAWATGTTRYELAWVGSSCVVEATMRVQSDAEAYEVTIDLDASLNGEVIRQRSWHERIPRCLN